MLSNDIPKTTNIVKEVKFVQRTSILRETHTCVTVLFNFFLLKRYCKKKKDLFCGDQSGMSFTVLHKTCICHW